jgi:glycosyltransferase involved in cell wall biosynthesis
MQFIVDDNQTGYLVEKFNVDEIASKLSLLANDKALRLNLGENGYQKAMQNYTEERYVKNVADLYLSLVKQNDNK